MTHFLPRPVVGWSAKGVGAVCRYVLQDQLLHAAGIALGEVVEHNLGPGAGNDADRSEEQPVVDLYARYVGVEDEVVGTANELLHPEGDALVVELDHVLPDRIFETATAKTFVHGEMSPMFKV